MPVFSGMHKPVLRRERRRLDPALAERQRAKRPRPSPRGRLRSLGLGLITGASDDDPSAIGTYAAAGAAIGPSFLWVAPLAFPMMFAVVYLSSKIGQVAGQGLFAVIRQHYSRPLLLFLLATAVIGNVVEAAADLGGMAAALNLVFPVPVEALVVALAAAVFLLQLRSYTTLRDVFRWIALALFAYLGAALLARPKLSAVLAGTLIPRVHFTREFLALLVAVIGTSLSAYLYSWQSNQDVEEDISMGRRRLTDRAGTTEAELQHSRRDIALGMGFAALIIYFIILSTAASLFTAGRTEITSAAQAARALQPLAGRAAGLLFALGVVGVGFLAVPVMTIGAAFDLCQSFSWKHGMHAPIREAKPFYAAITLFTLAAVGLNFFGINPMRALVYAGVIQGVSTPFLLLIVMRISNDAKVMGPWVNTRRMNLLGWITTAVMFAATAGLLLTFA